MPWVEIGLASLAALVVLLAVGYFLVARLEKTLIRGCYVPLDQIPELSAYHSGMSQELEARGYLDAGQYQDARGGLYKDAYMAIWVDSTGKILASIESGILIGMQIKTTRLWTRIENRALETQDTPVAPDMAGYFSRVFLMDSTAQALHEAHLARIDSFGEESSVFSADNALADYEGVKAAHAACMQDAGLATVDPSGTFYRHTWKGVLRNLSGAPDAVAEGLNQTRQSGN